MHTLIFATNNANKVKEIRSVVSMPFSIISLQEAGITIDIPEPHDTLTENAIEKSETIYSLTGKNCFSEDTGLEVEALQGAPGVKSARYAGEKATAEENIEKLLREMSEKTDRSARFHTVISLILDDKRFLFEGICEGKISNQITGTDGFGYDPVFIPSGSQLTFGEMKMEEKNKFSHRKKAVQQLVDFLTTYNAKD